MLLGKGLPSSAIGEGRANRPREHVKKRASRGGRGSKLEKKSYLLDQLDQELPVLMNPKSISYTHLMGEKIAKNLRRLALRRAPPRKQRGKRDWEKEIILIKRAHPSIGPKSHRRGKKQRKNGPRKKRSQDL